MSKHVDQQLSSGGKVWISPNTFLYVFSSAMVRNCRCQVKFDVHKKAFILSTATSLLYMSFNGSWHNTPFSLLCAFNIAFIIFEYFLLDSFLLTPLVHLFLCALYLLLTSLVLFLNQWLFQWEAAQTFTCWTFPLLPRERRQTLPVCLPLACVGV